MRRYIIKALLGGALILNNTSCKDYLDSHPDDILTLDMVFNNYNQTNEWLAGLYNGIPDPTWAIPHDYGFDLLADDMQLPLNWAQFGWWPLNAQQGAWDPSRTGPDFWGETYKNVRSAYILQNKIKAIENLPQERVEMMKLEARFLVAYYYSFMLELYGSFPLVTDLVNETANLDELLLQRTPQDEILNWLDHEFLELSKLLPTYFDSSGNLTENSYYGRPTKGMALACRARMWLFAASPLFNGNPLYKDQVNPDGTHIFPASYDPNKWVKAKEATEDLLNLGVYSLYTVNNSSGKIDPFLSFQNLFLTRGDVNKEIIFPRPGGTNYALFAAHCSPKGYNNRGNDGYGVTQQLVNAFYTKNGLPINKDPEYKSSGFSQADAYYANTSYDLSTPQRTKGLVTPANTFNMYVNREPRFYITVTYNGLYIPSYGNRTEFYDGGADGKNGGWDYPPTGYLNRKKVSPDDNPRNGTFPYRPGIVMRLGEFYLNYAEILNEIDYATNRNTIVEYLNKIRERAGIPLYGAGSDAIAVPSSYKEMQTAIRNERRVELAMEGIRYRDMRRWLIGKDLYNNQPITGMNVYGNANTFYNNPGENVFLNRTWDDKMYLWPIPQSAIDKNSKLVQNYRWN